MNDIALRKWAEQYPNMPQAAAILRVLDESAAKDRLIAGQAERIAAQADVLSRVAERDWRRESVQAKDTKAIEAAIPFGPFAHTVFHSEQGPTDYSRPPSLTPPAVVQMPGQLGAPDGLPMGDPAPESLVEEDLRIRQQEQQAHN